jgi:hypothetical protein
MPVFNSIMVVGLEMHRIGRICEGSFSISTIPLIGIPHVTTSQVTTRIHYSKGALLNHVDVKIPLSLQVQSLETGKLSVSSGA